MKVLIVNRYMSIYGGAETVIKELSNNLTAMGVANSVVTLSVSENLKELYKGIDFILPVKNFEYKLRSVGFMSSLGIIGEILSMRKLIKQNAGNYDVINLHNFPATWAMLGINGKNIWYCNEPPDFYNNPSPSLAVRILRYLGIAFDKFIVRKRIGRICVADRINADRVFNRYKITPEIIPYGIDYEFFTEPVKTDDAFAKYNLQKGDFILLQVGVLSPQKNQLESIKALADVRDKIKNVKLILAGGGEKPYLEILNSYIREKNLQEKVIFTGQVGKEEVRKLYRIADICLFPVKVQGGWLAPFEALCCEKPVIVSSSMGAADIIKKEDLGKVSDDLAAGIEEIRNNYEFYSKKSARSKEWVKSNLTWKIFTRRMLEVFQKA